MGYDPSTKESNTDVSVNCPAADENERHRNLYHQLPVNTILRGRYLTGRVLGEGGFGITYEGQDLKLQCRVAIKEFFLSGRTSRTGSLTVIPNDEPTTALYESGKKRFLDEARVLAQFSEEPNIVQVRDYFEENETGYIIMEFLSGQDLNSLLKKEGAMPYERVLELLEPAMLALDRVHQKGLIHRDISPANLMLLEDGTTKLLDFGTARNQSLLGQNSLSIMLKPGFAPEEQYRRHGEQGPWTDVYAMSATFYKLLTGVTPPPATDRAYDDVLEPPSKLGASITPAQEQALLRGLALRPKDRIQSMGELVRCLKGEKKLRPRLPKKTLIAAAALVLLTGGLGIGGLLTRQNKLAQETSPETLQETADTQESEPPEEEWQGRWVLGEEEKIVKETYTRSDGSIYQVITTDYDEYGRRKNEQIETWSSSSHYTYSNSIEYTQPEPDSPEWRQTAYVYTDNDGNEIRTEYRMEYREEEGTEVECRYEDGVLQGWTVREEGNSAEENYTCTFYYYYPDGSLEHYFFVEHFPQEDGTTLVKQQQFDAQGKLTYRYETLYNENWDIVFFQDFSSGSGSEHLTKEGSYDYDENGKILSGTVTEYYSSDPETFTVSVEQEIRQIYQWEWDEE